MLPVLALAFAAVLISLLTPGDGWRASLDRTGPFALAALLVIGLPFLCGVIIAYGGDAALC